MRIENLTSKTQSLIPSAELLWAAFFLCQGVKILGCISSIDNHKSSTLAQGELRGLGGHNRGFRVREVIIKFANWMGQ